MPRGVDAAKAGQGGAQHDDRPGMAGAQLDEANDRRSQHGLPLAAASRRRRSSLLRSSKTLAKLIRFRRRSCLDL
jgi:hypothetical protein